METELRAAGRVIPVDGEPDYSVIVDADDRVWLARCLVAIAEVTPTKLILRAESCQAHPIGVEIPRICMARLMYQARLMREAGLGQWGGRPVE